MLNIDRDINSLSSFKRNTSEFIEQMKKTGEPIVLTINGKAELIVQDAASYQRMLEAVERLETIEGIKRGLAEMERGEGRLAKTGLPKCGRSWVSLPMSETYQVIIQPEARKGLEQAYEWIKEESPASAVD